MSFAVRSDRIGRPTLAGLGLVVVGFMVLSLFVTATGTARFVVAMGYPPAIGYAIGALVDLAKGALLVAVLSFGRADRSLRWSHPRITLAGVALVTVSLRECTS